jgi:hypothetical protein
MSLNSKVVREVISIYTKSYQYIICPKLESRSHVLLYKNLVNLHQTLKSSLIIEPIYTIEDLKIVESNINLYIEAFQKLLKELNVDLSDDIQKYKFSELLKMKSILFNYLHKPEVRLSKLSKI